MSPTTEINKIPLSYATCSLGPPSTTPLETKLSTLHAASFTGIELAFPDLLAYANTHNPGTTQILPTDYPALIRSATEIRTLCESHNLRIMMLQPFANFEGWPRGSPEREDAFSRAKGWSGIMESLGTDMLQIGSTDTPEEKLCMKNGGVDREAVVEDLRELADLLGRKGQRIAYENWCWSTHAPNWKDVWEIVRDVGRENVGLCLDTFQTAGGEWGDPTAPEGVVGGGGEDVRKRYEESLEELARTVPAEKIFLLQVSDAYKPLSPFEDEVVDGARPRARWSHDFRPMPYHGGYLPIEEVGRAVLRTGFRGWFSMEIFDGGKSGEEEIRDVEGFAREAMGSMRRFLERCADGI
ncbi:3-dehydroshikimate dehydratase [Aspergillus costaricaensis CBS 115574]|uniref:3-dehydroshikimate dehydratase n=1 Tax=Aspergillus costaricaensis CBS 115574 TaxID=1448317 RepID=A0ACD1IHU1_9EURO|nr:3-dehydroshikimate dehydratase [Aspergillus costaricaensis CBS 115574]RAK90201.1 3-dehydroshikimate dehydratase [Aspergillus costaricaensis CBS 115574]